MSSEKKKHRHEEWANERLMRRASAMCYDAMWASSFDKMVSDGLIVSYVDKHVKEEVR